jgi:hypothetical protein
VNPVSPDGERLALNRAIAPLAASIAGFCRSKPRAKVGRLALKSLSGSQPRFSYPIAAGLFCNGSIPGGEFFQPGNRLDRGLVHRQASLYGGAIV